MNNATVGISIQKKICDLYNLELYEETVKQFNANYIDDLGQNIELIIKNIFSELKDSPSECTTFRKCKQEGMRTFPYNFVLKSGKTLSIRTNKNKDKIAPRVVGQAGYDALNYHFGHLVEYKIEDQNDIKKLIYYNIDKMLPIFIDYFFLADYTVWITLDNEIRYRIIRRDEAPDMVFDRRDLSFTCKSIDDWKESTTLKYKGQSFAEIQIHKNRTFKFRFIMSKVIDWLKEVKINNETLGITAEKTICDIFKLNTEEHIITRSNRTLQSKIEPTIKEAFIYLPKAIMHTGSIKGERGGASKCSYDFVLEGNKTLSLKTNYGKMVCPPEVGQPGDKTFLLYFKDILEIDEINNDIFKKSVLEKVSLMMPIYLEHLLDSDYLLWVYKENEKFKYSIVNSEIYRGFIWDINDFTFTKDTIEKWNESNTLKYKGISIGEFQAHKGRVCYKFRFNMKNLLNMLRSYYVEKKDDYVTAAENK